MQQIKQILVKIYDLEHKLTIKLDFVVDDAWNKLSNKNVDLDIP